MSQEDWAAYLKDINGRPATVMIDLKRSPAPDPARPVCLDIWIALSTAGPQGFPDSSELAAIAPLDDAIADGLAPALGATFVGSYTSAGQRHWILYTRAQVDQAKVGQSLHLSGFSPEWKATQDPHWRTYQDLLYPSPQQLRLIWDQRVVMALEQAGDQAHRPRPIEHLAYFTDAAAATQFAAWCRTSGFTVEEQTHNPEYPQPHAVSFTHHGPATLESINERTTQAEAAARQLGGEYDGWQTQLVKRRGLLSLFKRG